MNFVKYIPCDLVNGEGVRCTLFLSGCDHKCDGCYNKLTWSAKVGIPVDDVLIDQIIEDLKELDGISITGGDPLHPKNIKGVTALCKKIKSIYPNKDIWIWTGYLIEIIKQTDLILYVDTVIDGKFERKNPTFKPFRGSDNQNRYKICKGKLIFVD